MLNIAALSFTHSYIQEARGAYFSVATAGPLLTLLFVDAQPATALMY
jgi:hypothetical protein